MSHFQPRQYFADAHRAVAYGDGIEWEELPSLAQQLAAHRARLAADASHADARTFHESAWDETRPSALDVAEATSEFCEALEGLATREVTAPDVFRHFFGDRR